MSETQAKALSGLSGLVEKVTLELMFAEPGKDNGLLPIHSFISEMEESCQQHSLPQAACDAVSKARGIVEEIFNSDAVFNRQALDLFAVWAPWTQAVIEALNSGGPVPPCPGNEAKPSTAAAPEPVRAPKPVDSGTDPQEEPLTLNLESDRELLQEFVSESREHLQNIENGVLVLEENPRDTETLNSIFRAFHTFKGGSGFLNLIPINKLAHELESLLDLARQDKIQITSPIIEIILAGGDTLKQFIDNMQSQLSGSAPEGPILIPTGALRKRIAVAIAEPNQQAPEEEEGAVAFAQRAVAATAQAVAAKNAGAASTIKVDTVKLDNLIDMVGELVIAQSLVAQDGELRSSSSQRLTRNLAQLARTTKELQRAAMSLRMVPIRGAFQKMTRLVRDLSIRSGKQIELVTQGEDSELDRNIVEEISDPLVHMIRNAVDHGIEKPEVRQANGKAAVGRIVLSAFHQGGNFVIQISDDGGGIDPQRVLNKAVKQGVIEEGTELSQKEIFNLIFAPGFSTAEVVTDISGRGVGMDVVRRNIEKLRGKVEIESTLGRGSIFSIHLPLTLAIIDGLIVRCERDRYILPTLSVRESFKPTPGMISTITGRAEVVNVRGRLLPLVRLRQWLKQLPDDSDPCQSVLIVVEADGEERCVLVDELIGKQEVVIKSLGETFRDNDLLAGAAILGDGRVGLILEVNTLVQPRPTQLSKAA